MKRLLLVFSTLVLTLTGCVTFYRNPTASEPATVFVEYEERTGLFSWKSFMLAEVDGLPVSHMFAPSHGNEIRVQPGAKKLTFRVRYLGIDNAVSPLLQCECQAIFRVEMNLEPGKRYAVGAEIQKDNTVVLALADTSLPSARPLQFVAKARPIQGGTTIPVPGGGFVNLPGKNE